VPASVLYMSMSLDGYIPVLFGGGRRLFEVLPSRVALEIIRVIDTRPLPRQSLSAHG
jgi:hypothetical protein